MCTALGMRKFQDIQIIFALSTNEKLLFFVVVELFKINKKYFFLPIVIVARIQAIAFIIDVSVYNHVPMFREK